MELTYENISNNGERVLKGDRPSLLEEHLQRYKLASRYIEKQHTVLDCACGSGYGSEYLAKFGGKVIGVDISELAVDYCQKNYSALNLQFQVGSAEEMSFSNNTFDRVVSFETIEHIPHPDKLIQEAKRVLKREGLFIVSTPNRVNSKLKSGEKPTNPFHLFEWSLNEFDAHLRKEFSNIQYFGQRVRSKNKFHWPYMVSKIKRRTGQLDLVGIQPTPTLLQKIDNEHFWQPENFIAVCVK